MYVKPALPYSLDALMPYYSSETLMIHEKLHQGYVDNYNKTISRLEAMEDSKDYSGIKYVMKDLAFFGSRGSITHAIF